MSDHRFVLHLDMDAFFVEAACLQDSRLRDRPLIIGGHSERGVVASCCYKARSYGIHSAMPVHQARQRCPDARIIQGDMAYFSGLSRTVTGLISEQAPCVEKASIDEFYLDLSGMDRFFGCYRWAQELSERITRETGLPNSFGLSSGKTVAKVATNMSKPRGKMYVKHGEEKPFLAPLPVRSLPFAGPKTSLQLSHMGVQRIETLQKMPPELLVQTFGKQGLVLWQRANGVDNQPVIPYREQKSISAETTFESDTAVTDRLHSTLARLCQKLSYALRRKGQVCGSVTVKIRYSDFNTYSRQCKVSLTAADHDVRGTAERLFQALYTRRQRLRLIGVKLGDLQYGFHQPGLFDESSGAMRLYLAMDEIRNRFGEYSVSKGIFLR
jgi:DNA polymerase IV